MSKQLCCAILGHSPMRFAWGFDEEDEHCHAMKLELMQQIMLLRQQGVTQYMVACDPGVACMRRRQSMCSAKMIQS